jgi:hypothetical protein
MATTDSSPSKRVNQLYDELEQHLEPLIHLAADLDASVNPDDRQAREVVTEAAAYIRDARAALRRAAELL